MFPEAFLERMQQMLGDEYEVFMEAFEQERYQGLRLNSHKLGQRGKNGTEALGVGFSHLSKIPWAEDGYYYKAKDRPGKHPYHEAGLYYIQEPSAMAPVELLGVQPGERVLDLCAAPGGKSTQIAAKLAGSGFLLSNEVHPQRAKILSENIERMGIGNACVTNETPEHLAELFPAYFDRILVDAPCSGEGMFRKNEVACEEWSLENVALCANRQDGILDFAAKMLCPGGRMVYSTCTFAPEEDEGTVSRFLGRHGDFVIVPIQPEEKEKLGLAGCDGVPVYLENPVPGLIGTLRLWPHRIKGEGHYVAVLQKGGNLPEGYHNLPAYGTTKGIAWKEMGFFADFVHEALQIPMFPEGCLGAQSETDEILQKLGRMVGMVGMPKAVKFGDNLYLVPPGLPSLKGLKVLRPGLHLGELKKNRFEPSHALALALAPESTLHRWDLDSDGQTITSYLNGETFQAEGEKGWYLICVDGFSIGWGKLAGGIMKNHYPKGLRGKCVK